MTCGIEVRGASKVLQGRTILSDVNLTIPTGSLAALLGPSGCGKSTLLNLLAGFERPTSGTVCIDGEQVQKPDPRRVMLFQDGALFPWRTALDNVAFGLEAAGVRRRAAREKAQCCLEQVGLGRFAKQLPSQLSGGQRQRVAIARALATDPRVVFLDEPFSALDTITRERLQGLVLEVASRHNTTVVLVTHDIDEALWLADECFVMAPDPGRVIDVIEPGPRRLRERGARDLAALKARIVERMSATPQISSDSRGEEERWARSTQSVVPVTVSRSVNLDV